jgi:hypothetical protein
VLNLSWWHVRDFQTAFRLNPFTTFQHFLLYLANSFHCFAYLFDFAVIFVGLGVSFLEVELDFILELCGLAEFLAFGVDDCVVLGG